MDAGRLSIIPHSIEQDGFTHSPQPDHQYALSGRSFSNAFCCYPNSFPNVIAASEFHSLDEDETASLRRMLTKATA